MSNQTGIRFESPRSSLICQKVSHALQGERLSHCYYKGSLHQHRVEQGSSQMKLPHWEWEQEREKLHQLCVPYSSYCVGSWLWMWVGDYKNCANNMCFMHTQKHACEHWAFPNHSVETFSFDKDGTLSLCSTSLFMLTFAT